MKKRSKLLIGAGFFALAIFVSASASFAWFFPTNSVGNEGETNAMPIDGSSSSSYFAYGDGSVDKPFGIRSPRHFYNLAWLQYLGYFNNQQKYFELADNVDMAGWTLPPIGTEDNPFISQFNGQGFVVSNLTVSNDFSQYNLHPTSITGFNTTNKKQPHILGVFGVVGNYNNLPAASYNSATNQVIDTGIYKATIKTAVKDSLMGVAAGYVDATMQSVVVDESSIDIASSLSGTTSYGGFTSNISDYSLVGYTTKKATIAKDERSIYDINIANNEFNAAEQSDDQGWGGSINMKTIYERLYAIKVRLSSTYNNFVWRTSTDHYDNAAGTPTQRTYNSAVYYHGYNTANHNYVGNYVFLDRGSSLNDYMYLTGGHEEIHNYYTYYRHSGHPITDGNGNYLNFDGSYLLNGTDASTCTLWTFTQYSNNVYYISTEYNGTEYRLYDYNELLAISSSNLNNANRRWTISQDGDSLEISCEDGKIACYDENWRIVPLESGTVEYFVMSATSGNTTNYISVNSTSGNAPQNTNNAAQAMKFEIDSSNHFYGVNSNGDRLYLAIYYFNRTANLRFINALDQENYYYFFYANSAVTATRQGGQFRTYYVRYNNGWTQTEQNNQSVAPTIQTQTIDFSNYNLDNTFDDAVIENRVGPDYYQTTNDLVKTARDTHMYYTYDDTTYLPLNVNSDGGTYSSAANARTAINNGNFDPKDSNTGYIIGGSDYSDVGANVTTLSNETHRDSISKIRVSKYGIDDVNNSFDVNAGSTVTISSLPDSKVYTFNTSGTSRTMSQEYNANTYPRYSESKVSFFENALTTTTTASNGTKTSRANDSIYGLHFMNTTISKNGIVNASKVSILGKNCDNYQLPTNSIDFNLKQKGNVNFFAGTYFSNNNSFFSLYQIVRNDDAVATTTENQYTSYNTISDIKEIVAVYSNDVGTKTTKYSNIYKYKNIDTNGNITYSYSEPYRFDGNQTRFKMNKNDMVDNNTPYVDNYLMSESDFNSYVSTYGYTLRLDSAKQLGKQNSNYTTDRIYYFEFPMNAGEYCLGSVDGGTGAYLLYLDIGANAAKTQRTTIYEHFTVVENHYTYPAGVALQPLPSTYTATVATITTVVDASDSACVVIKATSVGTFNIDRNGNDVALDRAQDANAPPVYCGEAITLIHEKGSSTALTVVGDSHTYDIKRMQYYDFNVNLDSTTVTIFTDTSVDNGAYSRTIVQYIYAGTDTSADPTYTFTYDPSASIDETESMRVYKTDGGVRYDADDIIDTSVVTIGNVSNTLVLKISLVQEGLNSSYEFTIDLNAAVDGNNTDGTYYIFSNYIIEVVPVGGQVTIRVLTFNSGNAYTADVVYVVTASGNVQITGTSQSPIVITVPTNP